MSDPIGKCQRHIKNYAGGTDKPSRIDKYLEQSQTYQAYQNKSPIWNKFESERAESLIIVYIEDRKTRSKTRIPVLVDFESGIIKKQSLKRNEERYGSLGDVTDCLHYKDEAGKLIPIPKDMGSNTIATKSHSAEDIARADSSYSTVGTDHEGRRKQGEWRKRVFELWEGKCIVTGCSIPEFLIGSHIKRWAAKSATTEDRLDEHNGLLLAAHIDKAFEHGYISFTDKGNLLISDKLPANQRKILGIPDTHKLAFVPDRTPKYLAWHRKYHGF